MKMSKAAAPAAQTGDTRREFIGKSLLACASAQLAAPLIAAATQPVAPSAVKSPSRDGRVSLQPVWPLVPYGTGTPIYCADLDQCRPASALSRTWEPNRWKLYDFESEHAKGVMIGAGQNTGVPDLEYMLPARGWHAISFGLLSKYWEARLQVRLQGDPVFSLLTPNNLADVKLTLDDIEFSRHAYNSPGIEELFWKYVKLDDAASSLTIRQTKVQTVPGNPDTTGNMFLPCWLAYIKLVPLSAAEVGQLEADRRRTDNRRLFCADDAFTPFGYLRFQSPDDIRRQFAPYRDTDFSRMYWEAAEGDSTRYPSKVGRMITLEWMRDKYRTLDRLIGESYGGFQANGIDPFRVAVDASHEIGLEFHASFRVSGFHYPPPEDEIYRGGLYERRPEWRCLDRQGRKIPRLSYAFPGMQEFVFSLLQEFVAYPVDGICLLYNRRLPILGYEAPIADTFQVKYGIDPRTLEPSDPRWLAHSAQILTDFMRELRRRMRAEAARKGRRPIGITAVVVSSREENYGYGLDLETWVREDLIDTLVPYSSVRGIDSRKPSWEDPREAEFFGNLTRGTRCRLAPNLMPRAMSPEEYKRRADGLYQAGVENLFLWDCSSRTTFDAAWATLSRLGHKEELAAWRAAGFPPVARPRSALTRMGDWDLSYQTPG